MKNSKKNEMDKMMSSFISLAAQGFNPGGFMGGSYFSNIFAEPVEKYPYDRLGDGYELRPIEMKDNKGNILDNSGSYSHLYHNDLKVSDSIFRKGGLSSGFKDGYAELIYYKQTKPHTEKEHGFDYGIHVLINKLGDICLSGTKMDSYPYHCGGNLGKLKDTYYNLCTGEEIINVGSGDKINGTNYLIVEHRYDWYNKSLPRGVYRIDKLTCEILKIDEIKK
jgi:hypothetical protein